jgi:hypothetical protein
LDLWRPDDVHARLRERVIVHLFRSLGGYLMSLAQVGLDLW